MENKFRRRCAFLYLLSLIEHVPAELREPFYTDQYEQEHLKPPLIRLLLSSDIYCRAWRQALPSGPDGVPKDNAALLQLLAHRGLVPTFQDKPVKEADLHHKPIRLVSLQEGLVPHFNPVLLLSALVGRRAVGTICANMEKRERR